MKKITWLLIFLLTIGMAQAAMLVNETFDLIPYGDQPGWQWCGDAAGSNMTVLNKWIYSGNQSGYLNTTASWNGRCKNFTATTLAATNVTLNIKVNNSNLEGAIVGLLDSGLADASSVYLNSHLLLCQTNYWRYRTGGAYTTTNASCQGANQSYYNISIFLYANGGNSNASYYFNGTQFGINMLPEGTVDIVNRVFVATSVTAPNRFSMDDVCVCEGLNFTCCNAPSAAPGAPQANFTDPTPPTGDATNTNVTINVSCNSTNATYQLWFDFNDTTPQTLIFNGTNGTWTTNVSTEGTYYYIGGCQANGTIGANTSTRTWILSLTAPNVTTLSGNEFGNNRYTTTYNYSLNNSPFDGNFTINLTLRDSIGLYAYEILIYNSTTLYVNVSNTTSLAGATEYNLSRGFNASNWSNDIYCMNLTISDSHTANLISNYETITTPDSLEFKTAEGSDITITSREATAASTAKSTDRYSFNFEYPKTETPTDRTYIITSKQKIDYLPKSPYKAHFVIFNGFSSGGNWIDFEGTEGQPTITKISEQEYWVTFKDQTAEKTTFNSIGGLNFLYQEWCVPQTNQYSITGNTGLAGANGTIILNSSTYLDNINIPFFIAGYTHLILNGANYTSSLNGTYASPQFYFDIRTNTTFPSAGTYTANITGYWELLDGLGGYYLTPFMIPFNVSVAGWNVSNCTGNTTNVTIRILFYDEEYTNIKAENNWSVEILFWANQTSNNWTYNYNFTNQNNYSICLQTNGTINSSGYTTYYNPYGYLNKYLWINQQVNTTPWNISAYSLNRSNLSDVRITNYNSANYEYFENSMVWLERNYLAEGVWRIVQMDRTDQYGLSTFKVTEESVDYRLVFWDSSGNWLKNTTIIKFACTAGVCVLDSYLNEYGSTSSNNLKYVYDYNSTTGIVSVYWNDTLNATSSATLYVAKRTITGDITICNTTNTTGITLQCNISNQTGTIMARFYKTASPTTAVFVEWINRIISSLGSNLGGEGLIWAFILLVVIVMVGLIHPAATIFMAVAGLIVIFALGMVTALSLAIVIVAAIMGLAISVKMRT